MESWYESRYEFRLDDDIIPPKYCSRSSDGVKTASMFHFRTNFIFKPTEGEEENIGSERLLAYVNDIDDAFSVNFGFYLMTFVRLMDYCLTRDWIRRFVDEAMSFAREIAVHEPIRRVIPIAVEFDVFTLQQQGEEVAAAMDRAIRPERMVPLLVSSPCLVCDEEDPGIDMLVHIHLNDLPKIRVENVDEGLKLMDVCEICGGIPTLWSQITHLKCNHPFHSHCVMKWLINSANCPICGEEEIPFCGKRMISGGCGDQEETRGEN